MPVEPDPPTDPSMEDILASIRRILDEDAPAKPSTQDDPADHFAPHDDELMLDHSMLIEPPPDLAPDRAPDLAADMPAIMTEIPTAPSPAPGLMEPRTAEQATAALRPLARLALERGTQIATGGPTLEDLVREELRPLLKDWLDAHLPPLIERVVRSEIERLVHRAER